MVAEMKKEDGSVQPNVPLNFKALALGGLLAVLMGALTAGCYLEPRGHGQGYGPPPHSSAPYSAAPHASGFRAVTPQNAGYTIFDEGQRHIIEGYYRSQPVRYEDDGHYDDDHGDDHYDDDQWKHRKKHKNKHKKKYKKMLKKWKKGGHLPPGHQKRYFPRELARRLPPPPPNTERVIVDNQILLLEIGTHLVLDVIELAIHH